MPDMPDMLPFTPQWHVCDDNEDTIPWLERNRPHLESLMLVFDCTLLEAVTIMLLNRIANETLEMNTPPPDDWGPGAERGEDDA